MTSNVSRDGASAPHDGSVSTVQQYRDPPPSSSSSPSSSPQHELSTTEHLARLQQRAPLPSFGAAAASRAQRSPSQTKTTSSPPPSSPLSPTPRDGLVRSIVSPRLGREATPPATERDDSATAAAKRMTVMIEGEEPPNPTSDDADGGAGIQGDEDGTEAVSTGRDRGTSHGSARSAASARPLLPTPTSPSDQAQVPEELDAIVDDADEAEQPVAETSTGTSTPKQAHPHDPPVRDAEADADADAPPQAPSPSSASVRSRRALQRSTSTAHDRLPSLLAKIQREEAAREQAIARGDTVGQEAQEAFADDAEEAEHDDEREDGVEDDGSHEAADEEEPSLKYSRLKGGAIDIFKKDSASALAVCDRFLALGTHAGMVFILDDQGNLIKGFRSHTASILALHIDSTCEFIASAGMDGFVSVSALSTSEQYAFDFKRVMRSIALEPGFGRRSTRALVCGGMAGALVMREKSWFGHRETVLHDGEGPIWNVQWRGTLIAWANDRGVRIYDTSTRQRITFIAPPSPGVRADLTRCSLYWQDDRTLLVAWADHIKVAKVRERKRLQGSSAAAASLAAAATGAGASAPSSPSGGGVGGGGGSAPQLFVEITAIFQLDCMISGIAPYGDHFLVLAYLTEDDAGAYDAGTPAALEDREAQRRREGHRPELRIITRDGEELSSDVLSLQSFARFQCNDYLLVPAAETSAAAAAAATAGAAVGKATGTSRDKATTKSPSENDHFYVVSPKDIVVARPRDEKDHVEWLLSKKRFEEALVRIERMGAGAARAAGFDAARVGRDYLRHLVEERGEYRKAARQAPRVLGDDVRAWEDWVFLYAERGRLSAVIPHVPTGDPVRLGSVVYDMMLAHFLRNDVKRLLATLRAWPHDLYDARAVVLAVEDRLENETEVELAHSTTDLRQATRGMRRRDGETRVPKRGQSKPSERRAGRHDDDGSGGDVRQQDQHESSGEEEGTADDDDEARVLMDCLVELFLANRQPGKALPYYLRLRRPGVFDLIREHNLFTAVQDQALLLIEFQDDLDRKQRRRERRESLGRSAGVRGAEEGGDEGMPEERGAQDAEKVGHSSVDAEASMATKHGAAIDLLVDHTHSIPINRVVAQLESHPAYLYRYLDALFDRDAQLVVDYADLQVELCARYEHAKLMPYLRSMSSYYSFEKAFAACKERDYVPEMVFLLGRVGDNKQALSLIIERLGDVERAIDFAKEQNDDDLWEDLLRYSESKPAFIRGLLENVGAEIDPARLIRRIKDGLEIPGLKPALIKILSDFNLQISLLEGSAAILHHDGVTLSRELHLSQNQARFFDDKTCCSHCELPLLPRAETATEMATYDAVRRRANRHPTVAFLCRHAFHLACLVPPANIPARDATTRGFQKPAATTTTTTAAATEWASLAASISSSSRFPGVQGDPDLAPVAMSVSQANAQRVARGVDGVDGVGYFGGLADGMGRLDVVAAVAGVGTASRGTDPITGQSRTTPAAGVTPLLEGAQQRRRWQRQRALSAKLTYEARLRVVLKAGCPACRAVRQQQRLGSA